MRPSRDEYFLQLAAIVATRGTCLRRQVGCVLVNSRGHVLSTGYNGRPQGWAHCNQLATDAALCNPDDVYPYACTGARLPSGEGLDNCEAIHAEQNSLLQCRDVFEIETCYVTTSPCITCTKLLLNTSCRRIVFTQRYAHDTQAAQLWTAVCYNEWIQSNPVQI